MACNSRAARANEILPDWIWLRYRRHWPVLNFLKTLAAVVLGAALGLAATFAAVERGFGFGAVRAGPWTGWPKTGSRDADPYARAVLSRTGETPLGSAEGLGFVARGDSSGALLDPRCDYSVRGPVPAARWWTLSAMTPEGRLIENPARIYGFTSAEIVRGANGGFDIAVSRAARPGNWLPVAPDRPFVLALRLYDTTISATASALDGISMPVISRGRCE